MTRLLFLSGLAGISMILGGLLPLRLHRWSQQALLRFMAFGSGVLLGAAFLFIIPEPVFYPREGHGIKEYHHQKDRLTRIQDWITRFTLGRTDKPSQ